MNGRKPPSVWPVFGEIEEFFLGLLNLARALAGRDRAG